VPFRQDEIIVEEGDSGEGDWSQESIETNGIDWLVKALASSAAWPAPPKTAVPTQVYVDFLRNHDANLTRHWDRKAHPSVLSWRAKADEVQATNERAGYMRGITRKAKAAGLPPTETHYRSAIDQYFANKTAAATTTPTTTTASAAQAPKPDAKRGLSVSEWGYLRGRMYTAQPGVPAAHSVELFEIAITDNALMEVDGLLQNEAVRCANDGLRRLMGANLIRLETLRASLDGVSFDKGVASLIGACDFGSNDDVLNAVLQLVEPDFLLRNYSRPAEAAMAKLVNGSATQAPGLKRLVLRTAVTLLTFVVAAGLHESVFSFHDVYERADAERQRCFWNLAALFVIGGTAAGLRLLDAPSSSSSAKDAPGAGAMTVLESPSRAQLDWWSCLLDWIVFLSLIISEVHRAGEKGAEAHILLKDYMGATLSCGDEDGKRATDKFMGFVLHTVLETLLHVVRTNSSSSRRTRAPRFRAPDARIAAVCVLQSTKVGAREFGETRRQPAPKGKNGKGVSGGACPYPVQLHGPPTVRPRDARHVRGDGSGRCPPLVRSARSHCRRSVAGWKGSAGQLESARCVSPLPCAKRFQKQQS
jgi:hypothetical protein